MHASEKSHLYILIQMEKKEGKHCYSQQLSITALPKNKHLTQYALFAINGTWTAQDMDLSFFWLLGQTSKLSIKYKVRWYRWCEYSPQYKTTCKATKKKKQTAETQMTTSLK